MNFKKLTFYVYALNYSGNSIIAAVTYFRNLKKNHVSFYNGICIQEYKKPAFWNALIFLFLKTYLWRCGTMLAGVNGRK